MHFAYPLPWWLAVVLAAAIGAVAYVEYRRPLSPLTPAQRGVLVGLRVLALAALVLFLFRPIAVLPPAGSRLARAIGLLKNELGLPLSSHFTTEFYGVGDGLASSKLDALAADARRTDLS